MNKILCNVKKEDCKTLTASIDEANACRILFDEAKTQMNYSPEAFKAVMDYHIKAQQTHWDLWRELLKKYLDDDSASACFHKLKFDPIKKVIYLEDAEGCEKCNRFQSILQKVKNSK